MKIISSEPIVIQRIHSFIFYGIFAYMFFSEFVYGKGGYDYTPYLYMLIFLFAFSLILKILNLNFMEEVIDHGDYLTVKYRRKKEKIDINNIQGVDYQEFKHFHRVILRLKTPCRFGRNVSFIPLQNQSVSHLNKIKVVSDLSSQVINEALINDSAFVTVTAWFSIVMCTFTLLFTGLFNYGAQQNQQMLSEFGVQQEIMESKEEIDIGILDYLFINLETIMQGFSLLAMVTFFSTIFLLNRHNWARIYFITLFSIGFLVSMVSSIFAIFFLEPIPIPRIDDPNLTPLGEYILVVRVLVIGNPAQTNINQELSLSGELLGFSLLICVLFGWLLKKLTSSSARAEFT